MVLEVRPLLLVLVLGAPLQRRLVVLAVWPNFLEKNERLRWILQEQQTWLQRLPIPTPTHQTMFRLLWPLRNINFTAQPWSIWKRRRRCS